MHKDRLSKTCRLAKMRALSTGSKILGQETKQKNAGNPNALAQADTRTRKYLCRKTCNRQMAQSAAQEVHTNVLTGHTGPEFRECITGDTDTVTMLFGLKDSYPS